MQKATIKDVAKRSRVSPKTVSRVINNEPSVRERTRGDFCPGQGACEFEQIPYLSKPDWLEGERDLLSNTYILQRADEEGKDKAIPRSASKQD